MNYIYGTWSVLCALNAAGFNPACEQMRAAADWLVAIQDQDGGWGEDGTSYKLDYRGYERAPSTASQTAFEVENDAPGRLRLAAIKDFSAASLHGFVAANVAPGATWCFVPGATSGQDLAQN
jgi:hypothetical protein